MAGKGNIIKHLGVCLLLSATSLGVCAQSGTLLRRASEYVKEGRETEAWTLWTQVWSDDSASPYARVEAGGLLGESLFKAGRYEQAIRVLGDVIEYGKREKPEMAALSTLSFNTALHLSAIGRYDEAEELAKTISFTEGSPLHYRLVAHKAEVAARRGSYSEALSIIDKFLDSEFPVKAHGEAAAMLIQNRGFISLEAGDAAGALEDFRQAMGMVEGTQQMIVMSNLALAESLSGECRDALDHIGKSLKYFQKENGEQSYDYINASRKHAIISGRCGDARNANLYARRFLAGEKRREAEALPQMSEQTRLSYWMREKPLLSSLFAIPDLDEALLFEIAMFRREVSMLGLRNSDSLRKESVSSVKHIRKLMSPGSVMVQLVEYPDMKGERRYDALMLTSDGKYSRVPLFSAEEIMGVAVGTEGISLYDVVTGDNPAFIDLLYTDSFLSGLVWLPILEKLPSSTQHLYFVPEGIFHLWGIENMPLPEDMPTLHRLSSVKAIEGVKAREWLRPVKNAIIAGGFDYSQTNDGEAGSNPEENSRGIGTADHTSYESLIRVLKATPGSDIFIPLPATRIEADSVAAAIGIAEALHSLAENDFKKNAPGAEVIHLATHGYTLFSGIGEPPQFVADTLAVDMSLLLSGVALTGANRAGLMPDSWEDGVLSAREIASLDLSGAELVVLSACQTGRGLITDEGVSGLVRALKIAGAGTIVASLWEVDDNATRLFMQQFYEGLSAGLPRHEAFAKARKRVEQTERRIPQQRFDAGKMKRMPTGEYRFSQPYLSPYFHSAFILID